MNRSEINASLKDAVELFRRNHFHLPVWAFWKTEEWRKHPAFASRVRSLQMGWDITDFGGNDFKKRGLLLFCLRNGQAGRPEGKRYAEKIMVAREGQETPLHFHFNKKEDIIVRAGGVLVLELYDSDKDGGLLKKDVRVFVDEMESRVKAGAPLHLNPGQSITLVPGCYHRFYGLAGKGSVLVGEVSDVNDDNTDNRFFEPLGRFPEIREDEPVLYPLWKEIPG